MKIVRKTVAGMCKGNTAHFIAAIDLAAEFINAYLESKEMRKVVTEKKRAET